MIYTYSIKRRLLRQGSPKPIMAASQAVDYAMRHLYKKEDMYREEAWLLFLDKKNNITGQFHLSTGGTDATVLDKKIVAYAAVNALANSVILIHNHPRGDCRPSQTDIRETGEIKKALSTLDINLLDHIIIGEGEFFSFQDEIATKVKS